jgi:hypothetical protein
VAVLVVAHWWWLGGDEWGREVSSTVVKGGCP